MASCKLMKVYFSIRICTNGNCQHQGKGASNKWKHLAHLKREKDLGIREERRSWRVSSPNFNIKLFAVVAFLACLVILKPASALFLPHLPSEQPSDRNSYFNLLGNNFHIRLMWRSHGLGRRLLLQDSQIRPTPTGYPPPGDNAQVIPHTPSFQEYHRGVP